MDKFLINKDLNKSKVEDKPLPEISESPKRKMPLKDTVEESPVIDLDKDDDADEEFVPFEKENISDGEESDEDYSPAKKKRSKSTPKAKKSPANASRKTPKTPNSNKKGKIGGMTLEQNRRRLGDAVKAKLEMEKYCMKAQCHFQLDNVEMEIFRQLIVPNAKEVTPTNFNEDTPVVVAYIKGSHAAGEVFGKSKIKGGNRYDQREVQKAELVFFPKKKVLRAWWVMYNSMWD